MLLNNDRSNRQSDPGSVARRTRMVATLAVMTAVSVILLVLGTLISINTVFFTALASFLVGIVVVRYNIGAGLMLFLGSGALDLILNPDKLHVLLYVAMGGFILMAEGSYKFLEKRIPEVRLRNLIHLVIRVAVFFIAYMPIAIFLPRLLLTKEAWEKIAGAEWLMWALPGVGVVAFVVFDLAYIFVKKTYLHLFMGGSRFK